VGAIRFPCAEARRAGFRALAEHYDGRVEKPAKALPVTILQSGLRMCRTGPSSDSSVRRPGSQDGVSQHATTFFFSAVFREKNCHLLIQAYEKLQTPVKLVFAGGSSHSDAYAGELRNRQNENIRFLDWVSGDALDELLTNAMLFVLPSDIEGLSLALLDALGAGVCVLTSDIAENCELVEGAGFTFKRGDVNDLERTLRWLIADSSARLMAAEKAQQRVRENYLWPVIAKEVERSYWRTMGRQGVSVALPESPSSAEVGRLDLTMRHRTKKIGM